MKKMTSNQVIDVTPIEIILIIFNSKWLTNHFLIIQPISILKIIYHHIYIIAHKHISTF